jgi:hypothetical protein
MNWTTKHRQLAPSNDRPQAHGRRIPWRSILLLLGWLVAALCLYAALLGLDIYWNLVTWRLEVDQWSVGLIGWALASLAGLWLLIRTSRDPVTRAVSLVICLFLIGLGLYVLPPEPLSQGLFGRRAPSPTWYRSARLVVLGAPLVLWCTHRRSGQPR